MLDCKGTTFHDFMQKLVPEISNLLMESEIPDEPIYTTWPQMYRVTYTAGWTVGATEKKK